MLRDSKRKLGSEGQGRVKGCKGQCNSQNKTCSTFEAISRKDSYKSNYRSSGQKDRGGSKDVRGNATPRTRHVQHSRLYLGRILINRIPEARVRRTGAGGSKDVRGNPQPEQDMFNIRGYISEGFL